MIRRGLVLGAGGVLGFAWTAGTLQAVAEVEGWEPDTADVLVGTGSVMAATLGCGGTVEQVVAHQRGEHVAVTVDDRELAIAHDNERDNPSALPPRPALRPGSPGLLLRRAARARHTPPLVLLSALLPAGRASHQPLHRMIDGIAGSGWPDRDVRIRLERRARRLAIRRLLHEARALRAAGTRVVLVGRGPEDLAGMGANLMDPLRREAVLATALRTGRQALADAARHGAVSA